MATRQAARTRALYISLLGLAAACTKPQSDAGPSVNLPAAPSATAPPSATPSPTPSAPTGALSLFRGSLVDEKSLTSTTLAPGDVIANALGPRTAYVTVGRAAPRELRAFSTSTHAAAWAVPTQGCTAMAAVAGGVFCDDPSGLLFFDERTGVSTTVSFPRATWVSSSPSARASSCSATITRSRPSTSPRTPRCAPSSSPSGRRTSARDERRSS